MPLNLTASSSSRVTKRSPARKQSRPLLKHRSASSGLARSRQNIGLSRSQSEQDVDDEQHKRLQDRGRLKATSLLHSYVEFQSILETIQFIRKEMFEPLPEAGGFNSTRIAEILNFRDGLAPAVTASHLHALLPSPTSTEREISDMIRKGVLQRVNIVGRGIGGSTLGQNLTLTSDIETLLERNDKIDRGTASKFLQDLRQCNLDEALQRQMYTVAEIQSLMHAGCLTSKSSLSQPANNPLDKFDIGTLTSIASASSAASGSLAAVGGQYAVLNAGGSSQQQEPCQHPGKGSGGSGLLASHLQLSLPGTGSYLSLVLAARNHLVSIVRKTRYHELPIYLLRERWDGGIASDDSAGKAKKYRGEFVGILPARSRKWKQFYGISFTWILTHCIGANLIEQFDTGSVGPAVRLV